MLALARTSVPSMKRGHGLAHPREIEYRVDVPQPVIGRHECLQVDHLKERRLSGVASKHVESDPGESTSASRPQSTARLQPAQLLSTAF
jgi:hypothetical protein